MSDLTKRKLFSISNAVKYYAYSIVDHGEEGGFNEKGTKFAGWVIAVILFVSFYIMGGDIR